MKDDQSARKDFYSCSAPESAIMGILVIINGDDYLDKTGNVTTESIWKILTKTVIIIQNDIDQLVYLKF